MSAITVRPNTALPIGTIAVQEEPTQMPSAANHPLPVTSPTRPWDRLKLTATEPTAPLFTSDSVDLASPLPEHVTNPEGLAGRVVLQAIEILLGHRPTTQLRHWLSAEVYGVLSRRAGLAQRIEGPAPRSRAPRVKSIHTSRPRNRVTEAIVIAHDGQRTRAAAVWLVVALEIA